SLRALPRMVQCSLCRGGPVNPACPHSAVCTGSFLNHFKRWMPGWISSAVSGPITWMLSNATSTAWISQHQRKGRPGEDDAAQTANVTKEKRNENQSDQCIRGRPEQG